MSWCPWPRDLARITLVKEIRIRELSDDPEEDRHHSEPVANDIVILELPDRKQEQYQHTEDGREDDQKRHRHLDALLNL